jgi:tight adherence protein C
LQVYSQALRNKRKLIAQEAAAKLPIKLLIPLVFCLFPGLLTVLLGPAVINIVTHLMPVLSGAR